jgi:hypothetical protein
MNHREVLVGLGMIALDSHRYMPIAQFI